MGSINKKELIKKLLLMILCGVIAGAAFIGTIFIYLKVNNSSINIITSNTDGALDKDEVSIDDIAKECMFSVVSISCSDSNKSDDCGSGVIIEKNNEEAMIVTNYHVVSGESKYYCKLSSNNILSNNKKVEMSLKKYDADRDIALLSINNKDLSSDILESIQAAKTGDIGEVKVGQSIFAVGNALGFGQSATSGIISAVNRKITDSKTGNYINDNMYIQIDAAINPGNSGGALFNTHGELIGVVKTKITSEEIEGIAFAIPISEVLDFLKESSDQ